MCIMLAIQAWMRPICCAGQNRVGIMLARLPVALALLLAPLALRAEGADTPDWDDVSAIFTERCVMCHSEISGASKGLRLDEYAVALAGSEQGAVLVPGDIEGSEIIRRLRGLSTPSMPFLSRRLPDEQIAIIERWIAAGLPRSDPDN